MSLGCIRQDYRELASQMLTDVPSTVLGGAWCRTHVLPSPETCLASTTTQGAMLLLLRKLQVGMCPPAFPSVPILPLATLPPPSRAQLSRWLSVLLLPTGLCITTRS